MKTLEQLQIEQAAEIEKLQKQHDISAQCKYGPDTVILSKNRNPHICYWKASPEQAIQIYDSFAVVPAYYWKGNFSHWLDNGDIAPSSDKTAALESGPYALRMRLSGGLQYGAKLELEFFAKLESGESVPVSIGIEGPGYIGTWPKLTPRTEIEKDGRKRIIARRFACQPLIYGIADNVKSYNGWQGAMKQSYDYAFALYADTDAIGENNTHAIGMLRNFFEQAAA